MLTSTCKPRATLGKSLGIKHDNERASVWQDAYDRSRPSPKTKEPRTVQDMRGLWNTRPEATIIMLRYASAVRLASTLMSLVPNSAATLPLGNDSGGTGFSRNSQSGSLQESARNTDDGNNFPAGLPPRRKARLTNHPWLANAGSFSSAHPTLLLAADNVPHMPSSHSSRHLC